VKVDRTLGKHIAHLEEEARAIEAAGYDGMWVGETNHDPFLAVLTASRSTERALVGTEIAIAFARTPMVVANSAYDLQEYTKGRFVLGLGSQVKPHVERRFSMPWAHPAARMREFVLALRAIWACWLEGTKLDFDGEFYTHTLMTPFFSPPPHEWGAPPVFLAGVNERMTEVAGEVCDGFFFHAFTTSRYLSEVTLPALRRGRERSGQSSLDGFDVCGPAFAAVGRNDAELDAAIAGTKNQIAFYASTPTYRAVLDLHGWGDVQPELTALSKQGRWDEMGPLVDDEILHAFAAVGRPDEVADELVSRFSAVATRMTVYTTYAADPEMVDEVARLVRIGASRTGRSNAS
jgi:probable F420-dependent oxidoreductase